MSYALAVKKLLRQSFTCTVKLVMDEKIVACTVYKSQQQRMEIIAGWYEQYRLTENDFELRIIPKQ